MAGDNKKTVGQIVAGCGCLTLVAISLWMVFVAWVGIQGRGNDEEASLVIGAVTCACSVPIVILTLVGFYFAFRRTEPR